MHRVRVDVQANITGVATLGPEQILGPDQTSGQVPKGNPISDSGQPRLFLITSKDWRR